MVRLCIVLLSIVLSFLIEGNQCVKDFAFPRGLSVENEYIYERVFSLGDYCREGVLKGDFVFEILNEREKTLKIRQNGVYTKKELKIPKEICINGDRYSVVKIDDYGFKGNNSIRSVYIPSSVKHIGVGAFEGANRLDKIEFDGRGDLEVISMNAFYGCNPESLVFPGKLRYIGVQSFCCCKNLKEINFSNIDNMRYINYGAFMMTDIENKDIFKNKSILGKNVFYDSNSKDLLKLEQRIKYESKRGIPFDDIKGIYEKIKVWGGKVISLMFIIGDLLF
ncbi:leucine-rich repeat domain-containing protein [Anaerofustis sp.]|uniref:leucine-rich repeat domain-containing protein n=1 Tax=Anaerofustis sp. TaxID=1872517 RepID=UPI0025BA6C9F|nr:leucine-rich repeat domain-containing protein [Anaerofustis sp.]